MRGASWRPPEKQLILVTPEKIVSTSDGGKLPVGLFLRRAIRARLCDSQAASAQYAEDGNPSPCGNWSLDCGVPPLEVTHALADSLRSIPGVVDTGLFLGTASAVLVAEKGAVRELRRP